MATVTAMVMATARAMGMMTLMGKCDGDDGSATMMLNLGTIYKDQASFSPLLLLLTSLLGNSNKHYY